MQTPSVEVEPFPLFSSPEDRTVCFGSCFAEHFHAELETAGLGSYHRIATCNHFNPVSLADMLEQLERGEALRGADVLPSRYLESRRTVLTTPFRRAHYGLSTESLLAEAAALDTGLIEALRRADVFTLTLGTADALALRRDGRVICSANHTALELYELRALSVDEVHSALRRFVEALLRLRAGRAFRMVVTVSPQRYFWNAHLVNGPPRDFARNQLSKSRLRLAVDRLASELPFVVYFPSYEIVMDELRWVEPLYDQGEFVHAGADTPPYVMRRFWEAYSSNAVDEHRAEVARIRHLASLARKAPALLPVLAERLDKAERRLAESDGAPGAELRGAALAEAREALALSPGAAGRARTSGAPDPAPRPV